VRESGGIRGASLADNARLSAEEQQERISMENGEHSGQGGRIDADGVRTALARIEGPGGQNIVAAGFVSEVEVDGGAVTVILKFAGQPRDVRHGIEDRVQTLLDGLPGVTDVLVDIEVEGDALVDSAAGASGGRRREDDGDEHEHGHGHGHHGHDHHGHDHGHGRAAPAPAAAGPTKLQNPLPQVKNLIAVASGKGGVGKSTVAVNLALALKAKGARVGLLDVDIYGPSAPLLLGVTDARPGATPSQKFLPVDAYGLKVMSIGFLLDADQPGIWRGPIVGSIVKQFLTDVEWGELDYLCIDLPPGTGDAHLSLTQTAPITGAIIVTTPSELALVDAVKGLQMFRKVETPVIGIVENMSHYACPKCGHESQPFNQGGTERIAEQLGVKILGRIPIDVDIQRGGDHGKPITAVKPDSLQAKAFLDIADAVTAVCPFQAPEESAKKKSGFLANLFRR
jgi:ATP-binding protein involved in chromosome partitioning